MTKRQLSASRDLESQRTINAQVTQPFGDSSRPTRPCSKASLLAVMFEVGFGRLPHLTDLRNESSDVVLSQIGH